MMHDQTITLYNYHEPSGLWYTTVFEGVQLAAASASSFTDVAASAYYASAVNWAVENNVTNGTSTATFSPNADCTRAQIVTFLYRAMAK